MTLCAQAGLQLFVTGSVAESHPWFKDSVRSMRRLTLLLLAEDACGASREWAQREEEPCEEGG